MARIELDDQEMEHYASQLSNILKYIEKINQLDLGDIPATFNINAQDNVWDEDEPRVFDNIEGILNIFPEKEKRFIKIKKII